jgi:hypothetical protein
MKESEMNQTLATGEPSTEKSGWQPIETAPNGFVQILTYDPRGMVETRIEIKGADGDWWRSNKTGPTHWMPLPSPPSNADHSNDTKSSGVSMIQTPYNREGEV